MDTDLVHKTEEDVQKILQNEFEIVQCIHRIDKELQGDHRIHTNRKLDRQTVDPGVRCERSLYFGVLHR